MIHQFENNGYYIALDVNSGSVHGMDKMAYDVLYTLNSHGSGLCTEKNVLSDNMRNILYAELQDSYDRDDIDEVLEEIAELISAKTLFSQDLFEPLLEEVRERKTVVKALCLHVAHDCNLACKYCFAEKGEYHGKRELMSFEVGQKAIDFLVRSSGNRHNLEVDFFGGEPLMNWDVVKQIVNYGRSLEEQFEKKFRFTVTTNGVLLNDEIMDFINREMDNVVLSLDGRRSVNDRMRPFVNGKGSYEHIVPKFQKLAESRNQEKYYIRGTFTRNNLDFSEDVLHFADLGFRQISIEPVVSDESEDYAIRREDLPAIKKEYDNLAKKMIMREKEGNGFHFFHFMIDLEGGPCLSKRLSGCGAGTEYLAVTPTGELFPCHQFVGENSFLVGNVNEGITHRDISDRLKNCHVYSKENCRKCFARFLCSGGCMANAYHRGGDIDIPYDIGCEMEKKRIECALMMKVAQMDSGL